MQQLVQPCVGHLTVEESEAEIRSIELQLVRVETCGCADGFAKEGPCCAPLLPLCFT
jgi:hypothetical protein